MQRCTVEQELAKSNIQLGTLSLKKINSSFCTLLEFLSLGHLVHLCLTPTGKHAESPNW